LIVYIINHLGFLVFLFRESELRTRIPDPGGRRVVHARASRNFPASCGSVTSFLEEVRLKAEAAERCKNPYLDFENGPLYPPTMAT
jgi:hypothetical protein